MSDPVEREIILNANERLLVKFDEDQDVVIEQYYGESVVSRISLLKIEAMELANVLFEEIHIYGTEH